MLDQKDSYNTNRYEQNPTNVPLMRYDPMPLALEQSLITIGVDHSR